MRQGVLFLLWLAAAPVFAGGNDEARQLGLKVQAVGDAILDPESPDAMRAVVDLGTDSRYYTMMRGWLAQQLEGDRSIVAAAAAGSRPRIEARIRFLEQAIRAIDLE